MDQVLREKTATVIDFELTKYVSDSLKVAQRLTGEAEEFLTDDVDDAETAGVRAVEAWMVLNSAAVIATRIKAQNHLKRIRQTRNQIMAMGAALQQGGVMLQQAPETNMGFLVRPRET